MNGPARLSTGTSPARSSPSYSQSRPVSKLLHRPIESTGGEHSHLGADGHQRSLRYQFRLALPSRFDGTSLAGAAPPHHATQLAITRWISAWWYTGKTWSPGLKYTTRPAPRW